MEILAYISINLLLFSSWYILLYRQKNNLLFADRLIGMFVLGLTQIIATEMVLGAVFRKLYPEPLFVLNVLVSSGIILHVLLTTKSRGILSEIRDAFIRFCRTVAGDRLLLSIFVLFFVSVCWMTFLGYLFPSYSWDALYYHLPMVGQIMQSGAIQENPTPSFIQQYMNIFSKNINLFFLWNIIFLKSDVVVDLSQLCFTLAGVLSVYSMAVKLGTGQRHGIYGALLFFFTPVLMLQSTVNYVDGAVSVLFLIALNFLTCAIGNGNDVHGSPAMAGGKNIPLLLSGLSAGILLGSKPTGPLFIMVLLAAVLIGESITTRTSQNGFPRGRRHIFRSTFSRCMTCFILPVLLLGGYWYIRNWIVYGNPVYYMDVTLFGIALFKGLKSDWVEHAPAVIENLNYLTRLLFLWVERVPYYMYDSRLSGFGPLWFILFLPAIVFSLIHAATKRNYMFIFVSMTLLLTFFIHPRNWTTRYVMFITGLGAVSFSMLLQYFDKQAALLRFIALLLAGYTFLTANSPCIMPEKIKEFIALPAGERTLARLKPFNIDVKVRQDYGYWIWIEKNLSDGETLVYTFERFDLDTEDPFFTAPLWNRAFSNRVVYLKADSYKKWLEQLGNNSADFILVQKNSTEDEWIEKERNIFYSLRWMGNIKEKFRIVYEDETYRIARFAGAGDE